MSRALWILTCWLLGAGCHSDPGWHPPVWSNDFTGSRPEDLTCDFAPPAPDGSLCLIAEEDVEYPFRRSERWFRVHPEELCPTPEELEAVSTPSWRSPPGTTAGALEEVCCLRERIENAIYVEGEYYDGGYVPEDEAPWGSSTPYSTEYDMCVYDVVARDRSYQPE